MRVVRQAPRGGCEPRPQVLWEEPTSRNVLYMTYLEKLLAYALGVASLVAVALGFLARDSVQPPTSEGAVVESMGEFVSRWQARGFEVDASRARLRAGAGQEIALRLEPGRCYVVIRGDFGRQQLAQPVSDDVRCPLEQIQRMSFANSSPSWWANGVLPMVDGAPRGVVVTVLSAPLSAEVNPYSLSEYAGSLDSPPSAYVAKYLESMDGVPVAGPVVVEDGDSAAVLPGSAAAYRALDQSVGLYPGRRELPRSVALAARPDALAAGVDLIDAPAEREGFVRGGVMSVPFADGRARPLLVLDPGAFAAPCLRVTLMPHHGHPERVRVSVRHWRTGEILRLAPQPDRTLHDQICDRDGPGLYTIAGIRDLGAWSVRVDVAPEGDAPADFYEAPPPSPWRVERARCQGDPSADACVAVIRSMIHGVPGPLVPVPAARLARARCHPDDPRTCVLFVEATLALGQPEVMEQALPLLDRACAAGDADALLLRGEMRRTGYPVSQDLAGARDDLRAACDGGREDACSSARRLADLTAS